MNYNQWLDLKKEVVELSDKADKELKTFTNKFTDASGLIPDDVRSSEEYKKLKKEFDFRFNDLRYFNSEKAYKKFQKKYHDEKRKERIK